MKNKTAGDVEMATRVKGLVLSRERSKNVIDGLFDHSKDARKKTVGQMEKLLVQAPAAQSQAPQLQKEASAPSVMAFFEKKAYLSDAQRRFPELMKAANTESQRQLSIKTAPGLSAPAKTPVRSALSGGNA